MARSSRRHSPRSPNSTTSFASRAATIPTCSRPRSRIASAGAPDDPARACTSWGRSKRASCSVDRVVLGALVEGVWPPETRSDPWLSRPMRLELGLDLPERRVGLSAHDFAQLLGTPEVILSRAGEARRRADGRVALHAAACGGRGRETLGRRDRPRREISRLGARSRSRRQGQGHASARGRRPPLDARPTQLSVTEIEHWLRDPYTIYAKHILKLLPLDAVDTPPGARDRGTVIHGAIGEFTETYAKGLPRRPARRAARARREAFRAAAGFPRGARILVAALRAHRALVRRLGGATPRGMPRRFTPRCAPRSTSRSTSASSS